MPIRKKIKSFFTKEEQVQDNHSNEDYYGEEEFDGKHPIGDRKDTIIVDCGSYKTRAGFLGGNCRTSFHTIVGRDTSGNRQGYLVGDQIESFCDIVISNPVENGVVTNITEIEAIWNYVFNNELRVHIEEEEFGIFLVESIFADENERKEKAQLLFETYHTPAACFVNQPFLNVLNYSLNGINLHLGHDSTYATAIINGECKSIKKLDFGGKHINEKIIEHGFTKYDDIDDIKQNHCYIRSDGCSNFDKEYTVPNGDKSVKLDSQQYLLPETFFNPGNLGIEGVGCHDLVINCLNDVSTELASVCGDSINIVVSGNSTRFKNFSEEITARLQNIPSSFKVKVHVPYSSDFQTYLGANAFYNPSGTWYADQFTTKEMYDEIGTVKSWPVTN